MKQCQAKGKIMLLSMGGAASSGAFTNEQEGSKFADIVWKMFMGGSDPNIPRPLGDVKFDGVDLDIEGGSPIGYGAFVNRLRVLYDTDPSRTYYIAGIFYFDNFTFIVKGPRNVPILTHSLDRMEEILTRLI